MSQLNFKGRVVLVTGAGAGLGREYALEFAKRGASVVVNDLGSSPGGLGKATKAADGVVEEIRQNGGVAVPNYDSVEFGDKLVRTAIENFGRLDIVINNAGILRDRSFGRMTEDEWDIIHKIHLKAAFSVTKAAWDQMKAQKFGRVIMTSSPAGLYGNFGQTNYSAAKMGLVGLANTLALEGKKYGIKVNTIAPTADTRLTKGLIPESVLKEMKPEFIMPLVVYLCHDSCDETGGIFELCGGHVCKLRWERTKGAALRKVGENMKVEDIKDHWEKIVDWTDSTHAKSIGDSQVIVGQEIQRILKGENDLTSNHPIKPEIAKKYQFKPFDHKHDAFSAILYALGVGSSTNQKDHLKFLFEMDSNFSVLPSFGVVPSFGAMGSVAAGIPGLEIDPTKILHGEQYLELYKPIPINGVLTSHTKITEVLDKGSGASLIMDTDTFDEKGEKVCYNQFNTFVVGAGGFGGKRSSDAVKETIPAPKRAPDAVVEQVTNLDQAALYRLSGDHNPLHIEPSFAAMGGFKTPILHGLCTFGFSTRHVMEKYGNNDPAMIKAIKVRFAKPVLPGQTLRTEMWKEGSRVHFQTVVKETGKVSITGAYVDLVESGGAKTPESGTGKMESDALFGGIAERLNSEMVRKVGAVFQWNITKDGQTKVWQIDMKNGSGSVGNNAEKKADCTITIADDDVMAMFSGTLNPQTAFFNGKMKVSGNIMLAQKLEVLFKAQQAKL